MDVHTKLDELTELVTEARSMPMSASCILNRSEVLGLLDELRELLPEELHHAEALLEEREAVVEEGRRESEQLLEQARAEQARLVSEEEVVEEAHRHAAQIVADAQELSARMRSETDDYVDAKLANFEVVLGKTLAAVSRGREKLADRAELGNLDDEAAGQAGYDDGPAYGSQGHGGQAYGGQGYRAQEQGGPGGYAAR